VPFEEIDCWVRVRSARETAINHDRDRLSKNQLSAVIQGDRGMRFRTRQQTIVYVNFRGDFVGIDSHAQK
jgi:hypothetical protein